MVHHSWTRRKPNIRKSQNLHWGKNPIFLGFKLLPKIYQFAEIAEKYNPLTWLNLINGTNFFNCKLDVDLWTDTSVHPNKLVISTQTFQCFAITLGLSILWVLFRTDISNQKKDQSLFIWSSVTCKVYHFIVLHPKYPRSRADMTLLPISGRARQFPIWTSNSPDSHLTPFLITCLPFALHI